MFHVVYKLYNSWEASSGQAAVVSWCGCVYDMRILPLYWCLWGVGGGDQMLCYTWALPLNYKASANRASVRSVQETQLCSSYHCIPACWTALCILHSFNMFKTVIFIYINCIIYCALGNCLCVCVCVCVCVRACVRVVINRIQNESFCLHSICVCTTVYMYCIFDHNNVT